MSREIKFRVWDITDKQMYYPTTDLFVEWDKHYGSKLLCEVATKNGSRALSDTEYEIMQFTGLKDKSGNDIYEGDIIQFAEKYFYVVKYEDAKFVGYHANNDWGKWGDLYKLGEPDFNKHNYIVIGNKYQNPELILNDYPPPAAVKA